MRTVSKVCCAGLLSCVWIAWGQDAPKGSSVPIYNVTVVERTTKAINYAYRGGPTKIDFRGTVLLPQSRGEATVESLRGRTEIDAKFENLLPTSRFGREYLTYSLWAITPEGAPHNIGEVVADGSNKAKLHVTTELQAFALIVTAEPYSAARKPSDVVVMENEVRPDTVGKIEELDAKYELLPRGHYVWEVPPKLEAGVNDAPKVSMNEYEALLEVYEAQNATGIARAAGADQYAAETLAKAESLLEQARRLQMTKAPTNVVVETARESAQTAEDARVLAERRRTEQATAAAEHQVSQATRAEARAHAEAAQARADADAARAQGASDRQARDQAEADAAEARAQLAQTSAQVAAPPPVVVVVPDPREAADSHRKDLRMRVYRDLSGAIATEDTPRGLVLTLPDTAFSGFELNGNAAAQLARVAPALGRYPELRVDVQGYSDTPTGATLSGLRADSVRRALVDRGLTGDRVTARGLGDARPVMSNATEAGRVANRRVEVVITGEAIGNLPVWDHTYNVISGQR